MPSCWASLCVYVCVLESRGQSAGLELRQNQRKLVFVSAPESVCGVSLPLPASCGLHRQHEGLCDACGGTLAYQKIERKDGAGPHLQWWGLDLKNLRAAGWSLILGTSSPLLNCPDNHGHIGLKSPGQTDSALSWEELPKKPLWEWGKEQIWRGIESIYPSFGRSLHIISPRSALGEGPMGPDPAAAVHHDRESQVSNSVLCW